MSGKARLLLTFASIHHVLAAEKALLDAGLAPDLIPVPKEISANCGIAIALAPTDKPRALAALASTPPTRILDPWEP
ncbi:MAG TPA: DUF3343 domain-containing protein [Planctomycetota bacterium]|nr:DUF3343 domain-containing protein [Planctomycetota bacterium]